MHYTFSLLFCIIFVVAAGVPKPDKVKDCRANGGRCVKAAKCPEQKVLKTSCPRGRLCCAAGKQKRGNVMKKRKSKGCKQKHSCRKASGRCIAANQPCLGRVKDGACKNKCQCCIINDGDTTQTKQRGGKKKKNPRKGSKDDKGCKKKRKCKGFCVGKDEECLGEINTKGCKGKHCFCCTLGDQKGEKGEEKVTDTIEVDYEDYNGYGYYSDYYSYYGEDDYQYEDKCYGENVNGSCEDNSCFICGDGQCLPAYYKCDEIEDCADGSDEFGCPPRPKYVPGSCPREYKWVLHSCYKVVARSSSWSDARMVCQAVNGDLALIYDHKLFTVYMKAFHEIEQAVYWVGVHRDNGTYAWVNGTLLPGNSSLWGSTEDTALGIDGEDCVVLNFTENRLLPTSCGVDTYNNKSIYSICEYADNDYYG